VRRTRVKICGVYRPEDAKLAADAGADAIGMILHAKSPRLIEAEYAIAVASVVPPMVAKVGVFVNAYAPFIAQCARALRLDLIQLHGSETVDFIRALPNFRVVKAIKVDEWDAWANVPLPNLTALLVDSGTGGSGVANDWDAVEAAMKRMPAKVPVMLAGGLTPETVGTVARRFQPFAVDVSSGVEASLCVKSKEKVDGFLRAVRAADGA
jgi:phosphoribosylanthranilate isomerase